MIQTGETPAGTNNYDGWQFLGDFTVGGTAPSTISTNNGSSNHLGTNTVFNVANVTGDANPDLIVSAPLRNRSGDYGASPGNFIKTGPGTMLISALNTPTGINYVNTYTGSTTVNQGTLSVGIANGINVASSLTLGGGTLATGGFAQAMNTLTLSANSGLDLGVGVGTNVVQFANSSAATWAAGSTLSVLNWSGTVATGGGSDQVIFGTDNTGLAVGQLSQIHFQGFNGASILANGEVVPTSVTSRTLGDWDLSGVANCRNIPAMLTALTDLNKYKTNNGLSPEDLLNIGDLDYSGVVTNADIQAELDLVINPAGAGSAVGVPEPTTCALLGLGCVLLFGSRRVSRCKATRA